MLRGNSQEAPKTLTRRDFFRIVGAVSLVVLTKANPDAMASASNPARITATVASTGPVKKDPMAKSSAESELSKLYPNIHINTQNGPYNLVEFNKAGLDQILKKMGPEAGKTNFYISILNNPDVDMETFAEVQRDGSKVTIDVYSPNFDTIFDGQFKDPILNPPAQESAANSTARTLQLHLATSLLPSDQREKEFIAQLETLREHPEERVFQFAPKK